MVSASKLHPGDKFSSEPILLVVDAAGILQIIDHAPFMRSNLGTLLVGPGCVIAKNDPIRGTSP
jgi:hypothetical protein